MVKFSVSTESIEEAGDIQMKLLEVVSDFPASQDPAPSPSAHSSNNVKSANDTAKGNSTQFSGQSNSDGVGGGGGGGDGTQELPFEVTLPHFFLTPSFSLPLFSLSFSLSLLFPPISLANRHPLITRTTLYLSFQIYACMIFQQHCQIASKQACPFLPT